MRFSVGRILQFATSAEGRPGIAVRAPLVILEYFHFESTLAARTGTRKRTVQRAFQRNVLKFW